MKRVICILLSLAVIFGFCGCNNKSNNIKKAEKKSNSSIESAKNEISANLKNGDIIKFGAYEQDNNVSNGKEKIEWIVLKNDGSKVLLLSKYGLDAQPYNTTDTDITWEQCSLRKWLNDTFINNAFSTDEQEKIAFTDVVPDREADDDTNPGNPTKDKVFLLNIKETKKYCFITVNTKLQKCIPTAYASKNVHPSTVDDKEWWLCVPGYSQDIALCCFDCALSDCFSNVDVDWNVAVRPAIWINLG